MLEGCQASLIAVPEAVNLQEIHLLDNVGRLDAGLAESRYH